MCEQPAFAGVVKTKARGASEELVEGRDALTSPAERRVLDGFDVIDEF
jgi:hypothetical protein